MSTAPLVSIIIPHKKDRDLTATIDSIRAQTYTNIELIIQDDEWNVNANVVRNVGYGKSKGEMLFFCDDDIVLDKNCITKMVRTYIKMSAVISNLGFVYCNYDKIGLVNATEFGQEYNYNKLRKRNYISTMSLVSREAFISAGCFDEFLSRYQDWDLWLKIHEAGYSGQWIDEVLFTAHYDTDGISCAGPYDRKLKTEIIKRKHNITERECSIIIPVHNQLEYTKQCIDSIIRNTGGDYEIIVVNDYSKDGTAEFLVDYHQYLKFLGTSTHKHHSYCCNIGMKEAQGDYIILLNNDTIVSHNWNVKMVETFRLIKQASCLGPLTSHAASPQQINSLANIRHNITPGEVNTYQKVINERIKSRAYCAKVTGFCFLTSREMIEQVGMFDEKILAGGNEADWIIRAWKQTGKLPYVDTSVYVHHYGNKSYSMESAGTEKLWKAGNDRVIKKHGALNMSWLETGLYMNNELMAITSKE